MIDPQRQAHEWIMRMERNNRLVCVKLSDRECHRTIVEAVRVGVPVLLEDVGEDIDSGLERLILMQFSEGSGPRTVEIGVEVVPCPDDFKLYMTTQLTRPHFSTAVSASRSPPLLAPVRSQFFQVATVI